MGGFASDRRTVHGGDQRLVEVDKRLHQARLRTLACRRRAPQEIGHIVARTERVSRAMPEHDANLIVVRGPIEELGQRDVHP